MKFSLYNVISGRFCDPKEGWVNRTFELTDAQKEAFFDIFAKGCQPAMKAKIMMFLKYPREYKAHGIYERVMFDQNGQSCQYVAGQSYPDEVREIRKLIAKG